MNCWPRFFVAGDEPQPLPLAVDLPVRFAIDLFRAPLAPRPPESGDAKKTKPAAELSEWIVTSDAGAHLRLTPGLSRKTLPLEVQKQLNTHELLSPARALNLKQLFLFDLEYVEAQGNPPGLNDPVYLHGRMFGPFPSESPQFARGQLMVTRADVLDGLIRGAPFAFQYADGHRAGSSGHRCLHLMLPGGSAEELESGNGTVLAFPMLGSAISAGEPANQLFTAGLLYDLLAQLQADFLQENIRGAFPDLKMPVPSRRSHEARLKSRGFEIHGDTVYAPIAKQSRTWVGRLFQGLLREKKKLPPEGTLCDFLRLARVALQSLPGWPDNRALVLQQLTRFRTVSWRPGEDALLRPVPITGREPHVAIFQLDETGILSPAKPSNKTERYICLQVDPAFAFRRHADIDIRIEYQGGPAELAIDSYQDLPEPRGRWSPIRRIEVSRDWQTESFAMPDTLINRHLWRDADFAIVVRSKKTFRIRRVTVTGRGVPDITAPPAASTPATPALKVESGGRGWLDCLNYWSHPPNKLILYPRKPGYEIRFHGWIVDTKLKTVDGAPFLVLKGPTGEFAFPGTRSQRPDVVKHLDNNEAYTLSGVMGSFRAEQVPAGEYLVSLRQMRSDGRSCVEESLPHRIRLYNEVGDGAEPPPSIEALGHYWAWGIDVHGYDPCFRNGGCSGSGEVAFRVWLKKDRAYKIAVGLMEPEVKECDKRLIELVVDGYTIKKLDPVADPGHRRPFVIIAPVGKTDADGWVEVKVARHPDSKADHNVVMYGLWVFNESDVVTEDGIVRGLHSDKALLYWSCGQALNRSYNEILPAALKHLALKAGSSGQEIVWKEQRVASEGTSDTVAVAGALFIDQHLQTPVFDFVPAVQPERAAEFLSRLRAAPPYTLLALAASGTFATDYVRELKDALRGWGIHVRLPGEAGNQRRNLLAVGVKGLPQLLALELDDAVDLVFPVPPIANPGLVGHWKLDQADEKILDSSGRGHHGVMTGGKWIDVPGGKLLELDGSGYITIPYHPDFHLPADITLMFWMRAAEKRERDVFMAGRGDPFRPFLVWWRDCHTVFTQGNRHGQGIAWVATSPGALGRWRHVAAVVSGHQSILYIDGVEASRDSRRGVPATTEAPFTIGGFTNTWHPYFKGSMQDVRLYSRALSPDEILHAINELPKERLQSAEKKRNQRKKTS